MIAKPKELFRPEQKKPGAPDAKARELYGATADAYGFNKGKRDGALMSANGDWKNSQQKSFNSGSSPMKGRNAVNDDGVDTRQKKYQQLQSSVFGGGYLDGQQPDYDKEAKRNAFGSTADWKTEAGMAKPVNAGSTRTDTYRQKQKQLGSSVFEQTDYQEYAPINKKPIDIDNVGHDSRVQAKGRKTDNEFKQRVQGFEPHRRDQEGYDARAKKQGNMASSFFDAPRPATAQRRAAAENQPESYTIPGRETKATKQAMLASNNPITGGSSLTAYNRVRAADEVKVIDLQLNNLPETADLIGVKKMSGAKNIINVHLDEDNMKGICTGTGRI